MEKIKLNVSKKNAKIFLLPSIKSKFSQSVKQGKKENMVYGDLYFSIHFKYIYTVLAEINEGGFNFFTLFLWEKDKYDNNNDRKIKNIYNFNEFGKKLKEDDEGGYVYLGNIYLTPLSEIYKKLHLLYQKYNIDFGNIRCDLGKNLFDIFYFRTKKQLNSFFIKEYRDKLSNLKFYFPKENYCISIDDIKGNRLLLKEIESNKIIYFANLYYHFTSFSKDNGERLTMLEFSNFEYGDLNLEEYIRTNNKLNGMCFVDEYGSSTLIDFNKRKSLLNPNVNEDTGKIIDYLKSLKYNFKKRTTMPTIEKVNEIIYCLE